MSSLTASRSSRPIRTAIIGLSSTAKTAWASNAHLPVFLSPSGKSKFEIVALCNSSVSAAKAAIKAYNLPTTTKAYGSPEDLAKDTEVEFVICNTRVDKHYQTILPSLKAGKNVYIEWPIAANAEDIGELVEIARQQKKEKGIIAAIGLQRRLAPPVVKLRELLADQVVGPLLSVDVRAYGGTNSRDIMPVGLKYFTDKDVGGNAITISVGHVLDFVQSAVGRLDPSTVKSTLHLQRPLIKIRDPGTNTILETVQSNVPDLVSVAGKLASGGMLSFLFRRGPPFPGTPSLTWTMMCQHGEIRLVAPNGTNLQGDPSQDPISIQIHKFETDEVADVTWDWSEEQKEIPLSARVVQSNLYAIADAIQNGNEGRNEGDWVDIEDAASWAGLLGSWLDGFEAERRS